MTTRYVFSGLVPAPGQPGAPPVGAPTYTSIGAAVTAAVDGDIIAVAAGTYNEVVNVSKAVKIYGPNENAELEDAAMPGVRAAEAKVVGGFQLNSNGIEINGFEIVSNTSNSYPVEVKKVGGINNITLKSNYIHDVRSQQAILYGFTVAIDANTASSNWVVNDNRIEDIILKNNGAANNSATAIALLGNISGLQMYRNRVVPGTATSSRRGLNIDSCSNVDMSGCFVDMGHTDTDPNNWAAKSAATPYALQISMSYKAVSSFKIANSIFKNTNGAMGMLGQRSISGVEITGCTIENVVLGIRPGAGSASFMADAEASPTISNWLIKDNTFKGIHQYAHYLGPRSDGPDQATPVDVDKYVNYRILNNTYLLASGSTDNDASVYVYNGSTVTGTNAAKPTIKISDSESESNTDGIVVESKFRWRHTFTRTFTPGAPTNPVQNLLILARQGATFISDVAQYVIALTPTGSITQVISNKVALDLLATTFTAVVPTAAPSEMTATAQVIAAQALAEGESAGEVVKGLANSGAAAVEGAVAAVVAAEAAKPGVSAADARANTLKEIAEAIAEASNLDEKSAMKDGVAGAFASLGGASVTLAAGSPAVDGILGGTAASPAAAAAVAASGLDLQAAGSDDTLRLKTSPGAPRYWPALVSDKEYTLALDSDAAGDLTSRPKLKFTAATSSAAAKVEIKPVGGSYAVAALDDEVTIVKNGITYPYPIAFIGGFGFGNDGIPCFPAGQRILTAAGWRAVEDLRDGDMVITDSGAAVPAKIHSSEVVTSRKTAPINIPASMFGKSGAPVRLSPLHAVRLSKGIWEFPYNLLRSREGVTQDAPGQKVTYYHIELPNYLRDNLVMEGGVVAESYGAPFVKANGLKGVKLYTYSERLGGYTRMAPGAVTGKSKSA